MVQAEVLREIEALFLVGRHEEAVTRCKTELKILELALRNALRQGEEDEAKTNGHGTT